MIEVKEEIKKSKFIGYAIKLSSVQQANEIFEKLKKEHKKATHVCFAYKIISNGVESVKFFDDGEPNGTAGRPILSVIEKSGSENVAVFVVRYFGGIKLGAGGLVRAYTKLASMALEQLKNDNNWIKANWKKWKLQSVFRWRLRFEFNAWNNL